MPQTHSATLLLCHSDKQTNSYRRGYGGRGLSEGAVTVDCPSTAMITKRNEATLSFLMYNFLCLAKAADTVSSCCQQTI